MAESRDTEAEGRFDWLGAFVAALASRLAPGAYLHCATDWQPYAEQMLEVCNACARLTSQSPDGTFTARPEFRPPTRFERRGARLGHGVWDLVFERTIRPTGSSPATASPE